MRLDAFSLALLLLAAPSIITDAKGLVPSLTANVTASQKAPEGGLNTALLAVVLAILRQPKAGQPQKTRAAATLPPGRRRSSKDDAAS